MCASVALASFMAVNGSAANAECYDVFGCSDRNAFRLHDLVSGPNCEFFCTMRNAIFAVHHFCFKSPRAIAPFDNQGCVAGDPNALGLDRIERANAATILKAEQTLSCPE
jgi:YARHG domain